MSLDKILITGANSGLGKFLCQYYSDKNVIAINRANKDSIKQIEKVDVIIHCAFSNAGNIKNEIDFNYVNDNIIFTNDLLKIKHQKFIYISSAIVFDPENSLYKITKLMCESLVIAQGKNYLILRPTSIVGPSMRKNTITKVISEKSPKLTLSYKSSYNLVSQKEIADFIDKSISENISGIKHFIASTYITLKDIAALANSNPEYGDYVFNVPKIDVISVCQTSSEDVIKQYIRENE